MSDELKKPTKFQWKKMTEEEQQKYIDAGVVKINPKSGKVDLRSLNAGTFAKGNTLAAKGQRNSHKKIRETLQSPQKFIKSTLKPKDLQIIVRNTIDKAKKGDNTSKRILFEYLWGKPDASSQVQVINNMQFNFKLPTDLDTNDF